MANSQQELLVGLTLLRLPGRSRVPAVDSVLPADKKDAAAGRQKNGFRGFFGKKQEKGHRARRDDPWLRL
jgi:hypothetical protein